MTKVKEMTNKKKTRYYKTSLESKDEMDHKRILRRILLNGK